MTAGLEEVDMYVPRRQNTITQYIMTRPILELCLEAERRTGVRVAKIWWDKGELDLEGAWETAKTAKAEEWTEGLEYGY